MASKEVETTAVDALMERLRQEGFQVDDFLDPELIKDFTLVDKEELVNIPFVIVEVLVKDSLEYNGKYVVCRALTADGTRIVFADGSAGIAETLMEVLTNFDHIRKPIRDDDDEPGYSYKIAIPVQKGLTKNTYPAKVVNPKTGEKEVKTVTTYRLNVGR